MIRNIYDFEVAPDLGVFPRRSTQVISLHLPSPVDFVHEGPTLGPPVP